MGQLLKSFCFSACWLFVLLGALPALSQAQLSGHFNRFGHELLLPALFLSWSVKQPHEFFPGEKNFQR